MRGQRPLMTPGLLFEGKKENRGSMANICSQVFRVGEGKSMPRTIWYYLMCFISIGFWYVTMQIMFDCADKGKWFAAMLGIYTIISVAIYWLYRQAGKGAVTASGLEMEHGQAIPLKDVERIVSEGGGFPAVVFTAGEREIMLHIPDREYGKLAKTRLNQWTIKGKEVFVFPGEAGQELQIRYSPVGTYDTYRFAPLSTSVFISFIMSLILYQVFKWDFILFWDASILYFIFILILDVFRKVKVSVEGDKVTVRRGKKEDSFRISDVTSLERGLFQVKVTTKNGEVFRFPRACILLPEIIEEYGNFKDGGAKLEKS
jgi:hypothetical protein